VAVFAIAVPVTRDATTKEGRPWVTGGEPSFTGGRGE
jgi:hypothetical protein